MQILKNWYGGQLDTSLDPFRAFNHSRNIVDLQYADFVRVYETAHLKTSPIFPDICIDEKCKLQDRLLQSQATFNMESYNGMFK